MSPAWLDEQLAMCANGRKRCEILHDFVFNNARKNRFALFEGADLRSGGSGDGWLDAAKSVFASWFRRFAFGYNVELNSNLAVLKCAV